jgi:predicted DNA-binding transcriptional regulator YafY
VIRVTDERRGFERFMNEFASLEKHTETNTETGEHIVKLWYDKNDETELLIQLLSFGPVIEILSPPPLREKARERISRQFALLAQ